MKIIEVRSREIFDSRGIPTVECQVMLADGSTCRGSVPSGLSRGSHEAVELRDGEERLGGYGVHKAIANIEQVIGPKLLGKEPDLITMDQILIDLDGTSRKECLGANATLATSIAICKAQALLNNEAPFFLLANLCKLEHVSVPIPMFNLINGGLHADNNLAIQEIMLVPVGAENFTQAIEWGATVSYLLGQILVNKGLALYTGDEGGYAPTVKTTEEAMDLLLQAVAQAGLVSEGQIAFAIDAAASNFYNSEKKLYHIDGQAIDSNELVEYYIKLGENYPLLSIEDGMAENDYDGWKNLMQEMASYVYIVGDDLFATNVNRIKNLALEKSFANGVIIKPNQVGTVTEALEAVILCKENELLPIASHRSGETNDTFIVDFAMGSGCPMIKAGGLSRGERMAKYNHLLRIENDLFSDSMNIK